MLEPVLCRGVKPPQGSKQDAHVEADIVAHDHGGVLDQGQKGLHELFLALPHDPKGMRVEVMDPHGLLAPRIRLIHERHAVTELSIPVIKSEPGSLYNLILPPGLDGESRGLEVEDQVAGIELRIPCSQLRKLIRRHCRWL